MFRRAVERLALLQVTEVVPRFIRPLEVSANSYIRNSFLDLEEQGYKVYYPDPILCTDNAAMIASAGYYRFMSGVTSGLDLNAVPNATFMTK